MIPAFPTFNPQSDITAFELAGCMEMLRASFFKTVIDKDDFDPLPEGVKRHFIVTDLTLGESEVPSGGGGGID